MTKIDALEHDRARLALIDQRLEQLQEWRTMIDHDVIYDITDGKEAAAAHDLAVFLAFIETDLKDYRAELTAKIARTAQQ